VREVIFSGGEPLLRKDIFELLAEAADLGIQSDLCTNGMLADRTIAHRLSGYLSEISVSLDAAVPEKHDAIRGCPGAWEKTVQGIRNMAEAGLEIHAITMCCEENAQEIEETLGLLERLGVQSVTLLGLMEVAGSKTSLRLPEAVRQAYARGLPALRKRHPSLTVNSKRICHTETPGYCSAGKSMLGIDAAGSLWPCILLKNKMPSKPISALSEIADPEELRALFPQNRMPDGRPYWKVCAGGM
jgi:MoaA/NifB/PqqE/SkfB family radical SAM enzyme